jgi:hypothetical protein
MSHSKVPRSDGRSTSSSAAPLGAVVLAGSAIRPPKPHGCNESGGYRHDHARARLQRCSSARSASRERRERLGDSPRCQGDRARQVAQTRTTTDTATTPSNPRAISPLRAGRPAGSAAAAAHTLAYVLPAVIPACVLRLRESLTAPTPSHLCESFDELVGNPHRRDPNHRLHARSRQASSSPSIPVVVPAFRDTRGQRTRSAEARLRLAPALDRVYRSNVRLRCELESMSGNRLAERRGACRRGEIESVAEHHG